MNGKQSAAKRAVSIIILAAIAMGVAIIGDLVITLIEKRSYPKEFSQYVEKYASEYGVPADIVYATIKVESDFRSNALSNAGAVGLMQIMPDTFDWCMMRTGEELDIGMLYDPETNIRLGVYFLSFLYRRYENWDTACAAYNAGLGRVDGWLLDAAYSDGDGTLKNIPIKETREYVKKINSALDKYEKLY